MHNKLINTLALLTVALAATLAATAASGRTLVDNRVLGNERDGSNWASYGRTFTERHYSPLRRINQKTVDNLGLAWYYDLPPMASVMTAPLAIDGVLYFAVGYSVVHAMDAKTGKLLWRYDPKVPEVAGLNLRGGWGVRGIAAWKDNLYVGTHDGRLIAINRRSGARVWSVQETEPDSGRYITGAPWVFNGKVVIGHGGADFAPVRGYVTAYDADSGERLWRFYVVPGNPADGFENDAMKMAAGTWTGEWWKYGGGGTVWNAMAYDPRFNRLYLGTGNGAPVNQNIRSPEGGDNLFLCAIVALNADTGEYVWHYQVNPGESWDYNSAMDIELADLPVNGRRRPVILHAPKNGFFYVIDRESGKLLSAKKFVRATWADRIDLATGRPVENPVARFKGTEGALIYPGAVGAHSVQAMSYSPRTGLVYIPAIDSGGVYADPPGDLSKWAPDPTRTVNQGVGAASRSFERPPPSSFLLAWNPVKQEAVWSVPQKGIFNGATTATAGNLVFQGQVTGAFTAYAADTGQPLWSFDAQTGVQAQPITYLVDGEQYVTVIAGWRGMGGASGASPEWEYRLQPRRVLTFKLGGEAQLPAPGPRSAPFVDDPAFAVDSERAAAGGALLNGHCALCHGVNLASGGTAPDLRKSAVPLTLGGFSSVVRGGALLAKGMPQFPEFSPEQLDDMRHFIRQQARAAMPPK